MRSNLRLPLTAKILDTTHSMIHDSEGMLIAKTAGHEEATQRAEYIALCVNSHDSLVDAAVMAQAEIICLLPRLSGPYARNMRAAYDRLMAALKEAGIP